MVPVVLQDNTRAAWSAGGMGDRQTYGGWAGALGMGMLGGNQTPPCHARRHPMLLQKNSPSCVGWLFGKDCKIMEGILGPHVNVNLVQIQRR